ASVVSSLCSPRPRLLRMLLDPCPPTAHLDHGRLADRIARPWPHPYRLSFRERSPRKAPRRSLAWVAAPHELRARGFAQQRALARAAGRLTHGGFVSPPPPTPPPLRGHAHPSAGLRPARAKRCLLFLVSEQPARCTTTWQGAAAGMANDQRL